MIINHNLSALNTQRNLNIANQDTAKNMAKLSSGLRINNAADDAAGLAVSEKMRSQIRGLNQASRNASDGVSFLQTAEGYLKETTDVLQRLRVLSVQAANGIYTNEDRDQIQVEVSQLVDELDRVASQAQFNGLDILSGRFAPDSADGTKSPENMYLHIGPNVDQRIRVYIGDMRATALGLRDAGTGESIKMGTQDEANRNIAVMDSALKIVNKQRADLGAYQNRIEMAIKGIDIGAENLQASESRIRDLDMAKETVTFTKNQILAQASNAMLVQANQIPQMVLQLLR